MKRALAILAGVTLLCVVAYLSWVNPAVVEFRLTPKLTFSGHLGPLMVFAFMAGVVLVLAAVLVQAGRRAVVTWRQDRQQRRTERIDEWEEHGEELVWSGDVQHGRALLQKAWRQRPQNAHAILALAASYRDTGELQHARQLLGDAAAQHHTNPDVLLAFAEAHAAAGDSAACIEVLERLRALQPRAPRVLRVLRDRYVEEQRWQAAALLQEALLAELRDPAPIAHEREHLTVLRYQSALAQSEPSARVRALEALADGRSSGAVPVLVSLGEALLADGHEDEASVLWERTLRSTPRTVLVERLAGIATESGHRDRLRALLHKLRGDQVQSDNLHLLLSQLYLADGAVDEAVRELEAVQGTGADLNLLHFLWGDVHRRRGQWEQAATAYAKVNGGSRGSQCRVCQRAAAEWVGYCPNCGSWDSYRSEVEIGAA